MSTAAADAFVHLHVASGSSMRHGASSPAALVERAAAHGMRAVALTDRDGVYGAVRFVQACVAHGLAPVLGVDLAVAPDASSSIESVGRRRTPARGGVFVDHDEPRIVLLARRRAGWAAVCRLVSAAHREADRMGRRGSPRLTPELLRTVLAEHSVGPDALVVLLGPGSDVGRAVRDRRWDLAVERIAAWRRLLPDQRLALDVVSHRADPHDPVTTCWSTPMAARMLRLAVDQQVLPVLTNAARCADPDQVRTLDVLDAIRRLVPLDPRHLDRVTGEGWLKDARGMAQVALEIAAAAQVGDPRRVAERLLATTVELADDLRLDPRSDLGIGVPHLPEADPTFGDADHALRQRCLAGIGRTALRDDDALHHRLDAELGVIAGLGFASYFLTVGDIVDLIRDRGIRVAARGSGAGSLVNHLLGISGVDPVAHDLVFERFLSPLRGALPDIDLDVESARRLEIYDAIFERFGSERVACVSMVDTYRVRHAVRDAGAALGFPPAEIAAIATSFPHIRARDARAALAELPELRGGALAREASGDGRLSVLFDLVESLDALPRHIAMHPCGIVLSDRTLLDRTPVEPSAIGYPMSQFDKDDVEELGLLKLDVLGIRMQSAMSHAVAEIARVDSVDLDLDDREQVPLDDPATFDLIRSTQTLGCFQIESPGQRELIGKFAPETFDDLIIDISLFRPGPVKSDMVTPFLRARQGWADPEYLHPDLEPALAETCGVVVFHEQVLRVVSVFSGCSLAEADEVRRALGDRDRHPDLRAWFYRAALGRGYALEVVEQVWDVLVAFGSFGFCKAHAAAFALPTYQSAWLKAHHPAAFLAGVLTHDPGMYPKRLILDDARRFGIEILGLDVDASTEHYRVEPVVEAPSGYGIRLSLADVKGITDDEVQRIVDGRPYRDLADFWTRAQVSRPVVERLVIAGAFDRLASIGSGRAGVRRRGGISRRDLLLRIADLDRWHRTGSRAVPTGQLPLLLPGVDESATTGPGLPEMSDTERVRAELDVLGLDVTRHVIDFYVPLLRALGVTRSADLLRQRSGSDLLVAGVKVATQTPPVRSGRRVVFTTLDDGSGPADLTFFDDVSGEATSTVFGSWLLLARGRLRRTGPRGVSLRATGAWDLTDLQRLAEREGVDAVLDRIAATPDPEGGPSQRRRRVLVHPSGFRMSPYADLKPQGVDVGDTRRALPSRRLWHASPGSPGAGA